MVNDRGVSPDSGPGRDLDNAFSTKLGGIDDAIRDRGADVGIYRQQLNAELTA